MNPAKTLITPFFLILLLTTASHGATDQDVISMTLPESLIQQAISKSLPLLFKAQSDTLNGSIAVDRIENLQLLQNSLSSRITLSGHQLSIITTVAGHDLHMNIGSLTMAFQCNATIRFDAQQQTLYIIPVITGVQSTDKQKTEVASTLALLFNNREFPLKIEKLEPIVTETGNKLLNISMTLHRIDIQPDKVVLSIIPQLTSTAKKNGVESQSLSTPNRESKASAPAQLPLSVFSGASPLNSG